MELGGVLSAARSEGPCVHGEKKLLLVCMTLEKLITRDWNSMFERRDKTRSSGVLVTKARRNIMYR